LLEAGHPQKLARTFPAHPSALFGVRKFLRERAASAGLGPALTDDIVLAASEASANAALHSGSPTFRVSWLREGDRVVVEVADGGEFKRRVPLGPPELGGHGIALIIALIDEVTIREGTTRQPGTVVRMTKYRTG
jgi:anti-sigma regulatory factor (Ser/Thr protein kinase)